MLGVKRLVLAQYERALVYRERSLERVLVPGVYWLWDPRARLAVQTCDISVPELTLPRADARLAQARTLLEPQVQIVELGDREVGLVYKNGRLTGVLPPGSRQLYWRGPVNVRIDVRDISREYALDAETARVLMRVKASGWSEALSTVEIPDTAVGLLIVDGELRDKLKPGFASFWKFQRNVRVELVDQRPADHRGDGPGDPDARRGQPASEPGGVVAADGRGQGARHGRQRRGLSLQFALREAVGTRTLDELLADKGVLDREVAAAASKLESGGLAVRSVGVEDVILPGEMKATLNQLVEVEKLAHVNLVRRREETAAPRSLLYDGLQSVMKNMVRIAP